MSYTAAQVALHEPRACPGCYYRVEQRWVNIELNPYLPPEYLPGRWACHTPGCTYGLPVVPEGCICPVVDITTMGDYRDVLTLGGDPRCLIHRRAE